LIIYHALRYRQGGTVEKITEPPRVKTVCNFKAMVQWLP